MLFSAELGWFPSGRMGDSGVVYANWFDRFRTLVNHMVLPVVTFALVYIGQYHTIMSPHSRA